MAGSGPAGSLNPKRSNPRVGLLTLPAGGRQGPAPEWPLPDPPDSYEMSTWEQLWTSPQAVAWDHLGWTRVVARYARILAFAEQNASAPAWGEARQLEDRLGLTPKAMRMLLWVVAEDEVGQQRQASAKGRSTSPKRRLSAVDPAG